MAPPRGTGTLEIGAKYVIMLSASHQLKRKGMVIVMNMESKLGRFMRNSGPARFFIPLGIVLIVFGVILFLFKTDNMVETVGKVTAVAEDVGDENQTVYDVTFSYTVDGKTYTGTFEDLTEQPKAGDDIKVFYNPENPEQTSNSKIGGFIAPLLIVVGIAAVAFGIFRTMKAFKKSKELDAAAPGKGAPPVDFDAFKYADGVTEYYCRHDGKALKPGYILEDANRKILFEGKMVKQAVVGARTYEFSDHTRGKVEEHQVGHIVTQSYNDEFFSTKSWFKFDGKNIWDVLHERGLRISTNMHSKFPNLIYEVSKDGKAFARIETSGRYVHEDEAAEHKVNIPVGQYFYRVWTNSRDFEVLFLTIFAISETQQTIAE